MNFVFIFQVSTYQMCILLKFNQRPQWSYQEIADETEIPDKDLMRAMQSLSMGKIGQRVLARVGEGSKVGPVTNPACRRFHKAARFKANVMLDVF
jgi:hypothetical protein